MSKRASERASERASGPVLTSLFLFVPDHSAAEVEDPIEARMAARKVNPRLKFKDEADMLHRLFVCISGERQSEAHDWH